MSDLRNYIVTTKKGVDIKDIEHDLCRDTTHDHSVCSNTIPDREVNITDSFKLSTRNTQFSLTKEEAKNLRNDPRIEAIQKRIPPGESDIIENSIVSYGDFRVPGYWNRNEFLNGNYDLAYQSPIGTNTALKYMTTNTSLDPSSSPELHQSFPLSGSFGRVLTGKGVDLIVVDSFMTYHQDFLRDPSQGIISIGDPTNASRVNFIKWYEYLNIPGNDPIYHNNKSGAEHGLKCASIAAGNVFGWAPEVEIYFFNVSDGGSSYSYSLYEVYPLIKAFHESKSIDPTTGFKRPTVVTTSYSLIDTVYRGLIDSTDGLTHINQFYPTGSSANLTGNNNTASLELGFTDYDVNDNPYTQPGELLHNKWVPSINADAEECSKIGIIIISAAGNRGMPMAGSGSTDDYFFEENYYSPYWYSYYTYDEDNSRYDAGEPVYYHRAGVPGGNSVIKVANVSFIPTDGYKFGLINSSERGPRIDIGAISHTYTAGYFSSTSYLPISHSLYQNLSNPVLNVSLVGNTYNGGTSFAAPQIAGMACLWKQLNPHPEADAKAFKKFLRENANPNSIENPEFPDPTDQNGSIYILGNNLAPGVSSYLFIPTAQYRASDDRIKLANWPYAVSESVKYNNISIKYT